MKDFQNMINDTQLPIAAELRDFGVTIEKPESTREESIASSLESFARFVLEEQRDMVVHVLEQYSNSSVGELSGGSADHSIYRVSIHQDTEKHEAAEMLLAAFAEHYPHRALTVKKLMEYMLHMCNKRNDGRSYNQLGNLMFILSFGPVKGQVRHIDHMYPNLQICLYMSQRCPSTIIYAMDDPPINSCSDLLRFWDSSHEVPTLLRFVFESFGDTPLKTLPYAKYFASSWYSLNSHLANFGRLYQTVSHSLQLTECDPGTTLIAGGSNHVHAGPPATLPRMFAFATGIPDDLGEESSSSDAQLAQPDLMIEGDEKDGEVQYSPALLHMDLCCILFGMLDDDEHHSDVGVVSCKRFLLNRLLPLLEEYPGETYWQQLSDERHLLRDWLEELVPELENPHRVESLVCAAIENSALMYSPDVQTKAFQKQKQRQLRRNQRKARKEKPKIASS